MSAKSDADPLESPLSRADLLSMKPGNLFSLQAKRALVTGAAGGIGRWITAGLAMAGAEVLATDHDENALDNLVQELGIAGADVSAFRADLSSTTALPPLMAQVELQLGGLDLLVNCAAVNRRMPATDVSEDTYDFIAGLDLRMPFFLSQAAARLMRRNETSCQIHVTSTNARFGLGSTSVYAASKAGLEQLVRSLAAEWAAEGIRVCAIAPGFMLTPLSAPLWSDAERSRWILDRVPLNRPGMPIDLVGAALLLASDAGRFITGQSVVVDGGFLSGRSW